MIGMEKMDNDEDTFISLATATANVVRWLSEVKHDAGKHHGNGEAQRQDNCAKDFGSALPDGIIDRSRTQKA